MLCSVINHFTFHFVLVSLKLLSLCFQISEVVNSMKDLIDYSRETGTGPMGKMDVMFLLLLFFSHTNGTLKLSSYLILLLFIYLYWRGIRASS